MAHRPKCKRKFQMRTGTNLHDLGLGFLAATPKAQVAIEKQINWT